LAGGASNDEDESISGINVTPLVDITLVLLIIFMVTASYIVKETIEVELPRAAHGGETVQKTFALVVTREGKTYLNGVPVDDAQLVTAARDARAHGEDVQAIVGADKNATHGMVTHLLDVLKGAGVTKFAIQIEKAE
jgi:biopolymer transport protein ExbD